MRGVNLSELADLPNDATLVALSEIDPYEENGRRKRHRLRYADLLTALQDLESNYAGSGEPDRKVVGKKVYDTDDTLLKLYRSVAAAPKVVLDHAKAYAQDLATAGTETFKLGGAIDVNTTQVSSGFPANLMSYIVPANTLSANNQILETIGFFTCLTGAAALTLLWNGQGISNLSTFAQSDTNGIVKLFVVRSGANSQKLFGFAKGNIDSSGNTSFVWGNGTDTADLSTNITIVGRVTAVGASAAQEIMLTKLL